MIDYAQSTYIWLGYGCAAVTMLGLYFYTLRQQTLLNRQIKKFEELASQNQVPVHGNIAQNR